MTQSKRCHEDSHEACRGRAWDDRGCAWIPCGCDCHSSADPERSCSECPRPWIAWGLCEAHYRRAKREGLTPDRTDPVMRFRRGYIVAASGCWEWQGSMWQGYGRLSVGGRLAHVHRWSYEHHIGPIPDGLQIDHLCRNRACVNPEHLEAVTLQENIARRPPTDRNFQAAKTRCPRGHEYDHITAGGRRRCRTCDRASWRRSYQRRRARGSGGPTTPPA